MFRHFNAWRVTMLIWESVVMVSIRSCMLLSLCTLGNMQWLLPFITDTSRWVRYEIPICVLKLSSSVSGYHHHNWKIVNSVLYCIAAWSFLSSFSCNAKKQGSGVWPHLGLWCQDWCHLGVLLQLLDVWLIVYTSNRQTINGHCQNTFHILIYICILCRLIPTLYMWSCSKLSLSTICCIVFFTLI